MIKRICDCCGVEIKKEFVQFHINWNMADAVSGESGKESSRDTPYLEYCEDCFNKALERLGLDKE